jgi:predicted metalloprotease with PDZ domain
MKPIRHTLSFPAPHTHYVDVRVEVPSAGRDSVELSMAVWTPGSYLVREFSRHVEAVTAAGPFGAAFPVDKTAKNRWRIATAGAPKVVVSYRVYGREMSVRTNWIESDFAFVNGAPTFLTLADPSTALGAGEKARPHEVSIVFDPGWTSSITALEPGVRRRPDTAVTHTYLFSGPSLPGPGVWNPDQFRVYRL